MRILPCAPDSRGRQMLFGLLPHSERLCSAVHGDSPTAADIHSLPNHGHVSIDSLAFFGAHPGWQQKCVCHAQRVASARGTPSKHIEDAKRSLGACAPAPLVVVGRAWRV
eukprot:scaffold54565_cov26-Tisochrysis_lutea.AAC.1